METIQGRKLFKGGNYRRKYGIYKIQGSITLYKKIQRHLVLDFSVLNYISIRDIHYNHSIAIQIRKQFNGIVQIKRIAMVKNEKSLSKGLSLLI